MNQKEKINYMRIAASIVGFGFNPKDLDMLVSIYDFVKENKGDSDLRSITKIQVEVEKRNKSLIKDNKETKKK